MVYASTLNFGSLVLAGANGNTCQIISKVKVQGTIKQRHNGYLTMVEIPGKPKDWEIRISGKLGGDARDTDLQTLYSYDDGEARRYDDGIISMDCMIVPGSLRVEDSANNKGEYVYSMTLRQDQ